jgi:hypothetical protein
MDKMIEFYLDKFFEFLRKNLREAVIITRLTSLTSVFMVSLMLGYELICIDQSFLTFVLAIAVQKVSWKASKGFSKVCVDAIIDAVKDVNKD